MTKRFLVLVAGAVLVFSALQLEAAVRVVTFSFGAATADYTVPAGKVLLIEHVSAFYGNSGGGPAFDKVVLTIASSTENNPLATTTTAWSVSTSNAYQMINLDRPLRATAGDKLNIFDTFTGAAKQVEIQGLLVDQADLYAANLDLDLKGVAKTSSALTATVKVTSARPAILHSTTSPDLQSWVENLTQIVTPRSEHGLFDVSTGLASDSRKFLSVTGLAPEIP